MTMRKSGRLILNISGAIYETKIRTLRRFPNTLLGNQEKRLVHYCSVSGQYFFQRSRVFFDAILFFYQSGGLLSCPPGIPYDLFEEECRFFELPEEAIQKMKPRELGDLASDDEDEDDSPHPTTIRSKLWDILQNPETSGGAKFFSLFSLFMIALSVISSCLESVPALQARTKVYSENPWAINELVLNSWFLLELVLATLCAPNLKDFLLSAMTWIDLVAVVPYFIVLSISRDKLQSFGFLRIVRLVRVTRMFRLSKHSARLKLVGKILLSCVGDFKTLLLCLVMIVTLAGSLMYYMEDRGSYGSGFTTIPMGIYWAIQSITTVGYGDIYPFSYAGKTFAGAFMLFGAVTLSIPVLSIVTKFEAEYEIQH